MNINSIIDNINNSIASSTNSKIELKENSFLLNLLKEEKKTKSKKNSFAVSKPWKDFTSNRFPITTFLLRLFLLTIEIPIYVLYSSARVVRSLILGRKSDKDLSLSPRFNFVLFVWAIIFYATAIIYILIFFSKSVLLFNPNNSVNDYGAINIQQPCGIEHYIYMFNTAECWANTGIKVLEGDEIKIYASGAFYSKISQMNNYSKENSKLKYDRIGVSKINSFAADTTRQFLIYKDKDAKFGSLLLQIKEDSDEPLYDSEDRTRKRIYQLTKNKKEEGFSPITVDSAGVLCFAVNDIYFTRPLWEKLKDTTYQDYFDIKSIQNYKKEDVKIANIIYDSIQPDMWFYDNVGEILLSITVTRNSISDSEAMPNDIVKLYRWVERETLPLKKWELIGYLFLGIIAISLWCSLDYFIGSRIRR